MINIISKAYCRHYQSGPKKVVDNLVKGLEKIGYPYVVNKRLDACKRLWIHDDLSALQEAVHLPEEVKVVIGPNLVVMPRNLPSDLEMRRFVYIHPSEWAKKFWEDAGFAKCPIVAWPTGIDTVEFTPGSEPRTSVVVYFKQRFPEELQYVEQELQRRGLTYRLVRYPEYREAAYKNLLREAKYVIWIGRQESQGIALEEALATGIPVLLWDVKTMGHWLATEREMKFFTAEENRHFATSAEYFDETCGIRIYGEEEFASALERMEYEWRNFTPREYIFTHLSLEKQARDFVEIYNTHFGLRFDLGRTEQVRNKGNWSNRGLKNRTLFLAKDIAKSAIRFAKQRKII